MFIYSRGTCSSSSRKEDSNLISTSAQFLCTHNFSGQFSELKIGKNWPQARIRASKQLNNKKLRIVVCKSKDFQNFYTKNYFDPSNREFCLTL